MTELKPHLKAVQHPNPRRRTFHVVREVYQGRHMYGFGKEDSMFSSMDKEDPGDLAKELIKRLGMIPGVTDGHLKSYEISIGIGDAFNWKEIGPMVLGEIVSAVYPDVVGHTLEVSTEIGWSYWVRPGGRGFGGMFDGDDDGQRTRYQDMVDRQPIEVNFGAGRPMLDIEHLLGSNVLQEAKQKAAEEAVHED